MATISNLNASYLELFWVELSWVKLGLGFDNNLAFKNIIQILFWFPLLLDEHKQALR